MDNVAPALITCPTGGSVQKTTSVLESGYKGSRADPYLYNRAGVGASATPYYKCMFGKGKSVGIGLLLGL